MSVMFTPTRIGALELKNRFMHSATYECMAGEDGTVTDPLVQRYRNLARGEVGLIVPGYMYVETPGKAVPFQTGIHSDAMVPGLKNLARMVHENGSKVIFQLAHAGRLTKKSTTGETPMGPSSKGRDPAYLNKPRRMNEEDIGRVVRAFGKAAERAVEAGADGVQIHAAHGYLVNQFLSPFFNDRKDKWGGSDENRFRFLEQVLLDVKRSVPEDFPVLVKLNTLDHTPKPGITHETAVNYARKIVTLGIDAIEVSSGTMTHSFMNTCRGDVPVDEIVRSLPFWMRPMGRIMMNRLVGKFDLEEAYHRDAASALKSETGDVPLILVGGMRSVAVMEQVVRESLADMISMSRPFIREPMLVKRIREGKTDRASCVSCNKCFGAIVSQMPLRCFHKAA